MIKKLMIASDLHGSAYWCQRLLDAFDAEEADHLLLLGDILYHGPRNNLPQGHNPKEVIAMLNARSDRLLCVRGNCDAEVDQMVLSFPIMAEQMILVLGEQTVHATHGHHFHKDNPLPHQVGDILLYGHTHVPLCEKREDFIAMNPGSAALPKQNSAHSMIIWESGHFIWKNLETGTVFMEYAFR